MGRCFVYGTSHRNDVQAIFRGYGGVEYQGQTQQKSERLNVAL